jgi:hypothetical protein
LTEPKPSHVRGGAGLGQQSIELDNFRSNHSNVTALGSGESIMLLAIFFIVTIGFMLFGSCVLAE